MHILIIPSWFPKHSGDVSGIFFLDQANALVDSGNKVGVIAQYPVSIRDLKKSKAPLISEETSGGALIIYRRYFLVFLPKIPYGIYLLWLFSAFRQIVNYIEHHGKPDIIHAHSAVYAGAIATKFGKLFNIPVVITEHSSAYALKLYSNWEVDLAITAFLSADILISVSTSLAELLRSVTHKQDLKIEVLPNIVAKRFFDFSLKESKLSSNFRIINIGTLDQNKNQACLIKSYMYVAKQLPFSQLVIVGDGPSRLELKNMSKDLESDGKITFVEECSPDNIPSLMATADLVVLSSNYETFGLVAAEALVLGIPVIATMCGGPQDIVNDSNGLLVPKNSHVDLSNAILYIYNNRKSYQSKEIAKNARGKFAASIVCNNLNSIYKDLITHE